MHAGWPTLVAVLTLAARASVGRTAELDVQGNWQLNVDCGYSATGTSFLAIDQAPGGRAITASPTTCGSFEVPGAIRRIASCTSTPATYDGSIVEDAVTLPDEPLLTEVTTIPAGRREGADGSASEALRSLALDTGAPRSLAELGMSREGIDVVVDEIAGAADQDAIRALLEEAFEPMMPEAPERGTS